MASGSFNVSTNNTYISGKVTWSSTKDTVNNRSLVSAELRLSRTNTGYETWGTGTFYLAINGNQDSETKSVSIKYNSNTLCISHSVYVTHDADGDKNCTIGWSGGISGVFSINASSGTAKLDTIPRESSLTGGYSWTAGNSTTFTISRYSSSFTHDVLVEVYNGSSYQTIHNITGITGTSYTWTPDSTDMVTLYDYCNNDTTNWNQSTRITLTTKSGSTVIGTDQKIGTLSSPSNSTTSSSLSFEVGNSVAISISRSQTAMYHTLRFYVNNTLIHTKTSVSTSYTWVPTTTEINNMYAAMSTVNSATSKVEIDTWIDLATDQRVRGTYTKTGTATISSANPLFTTATYADTNATTTGITGNNQYIIKNKSTLVATVINANKAVAQKGASITKYVASVAGETITINSPFATNITFDFGIINTPNNQTLTVSAYDSRNNKTDVKLSVSVVDWEAPKLTTTSATRVNGFENAVTLVLGGTISPLSVGGTNKNSLVAASCTYRWREKGLTSWSTAYNFSGLTVTMPNFSANNTAVNGSTGLSNTKVWEIEVAITDKLVTNFIILEVKSGKPLLHIDEAMETVSIGKFPTGVAGSGGRPFEVKGGAMFDGGYLELAAYNEETYGIGMMQAYYDANNAMLKIYGKNGSYTTIPITLSMLGGLLESGGLLVRGNNTQIKIEEADNSNKGWHVEVNSGDFHIAETSVKIHATFMQNGNLWLRSGELTNESRITPSLLNGWVGYGSTYNWPSYWKDKNGVVHITGLIKSGTTTTDTKLFLLPAGYRPYSREIHHVPTSSSVSTTSPTPACRIDVNDDGYVSLMYHANAAWTSLANISFKAEK